jgi:hypothetical protein
MGGVGMPFDYFPCLPRVFDFPPKISCRLHSSSNLIMSFLFIERLVLQLIWSYLTLYQNQFHDKAYTCILCCKWSDIVSLFEHLAWYSIAFNIDRRDADKT